MSKTGRINTARRTAWSGYYADRALLGFSFAWIVGRWAKRQLIIERPEVLYEPLTWLGALAFPEPISDAAWLSLAALMTASIGLCLWRPRLIAARVGVAICALLLISTELAYGKMEHVNHLFLLAHVYAIFLPMGRPGQPYSAESESDEGVAIQAEATRWYQAGLLLIYTMAGLWKFFDMTLRSLLKPEMTWLHPEAMPALTALSYRAHDFALSIPEALWTIRWIFPAGYVVLAFLLATAVLAPFRRPLLLLILPTVVLFHIMNVLTVYALFLSTIIVAVLLFTPYDLLVPAIRRHLTPVTNTTFEGVGADARYERHYANGDVDVFKGFYAYRTRLEDRNWLRAAPLYYPGVALLATRILERRTYTPRSV